MFNNRSLLLAQISLHAHLGISFVVPGHSPPFLCHCFWRTCTCFTRESKRAEERWLNQYLAKVKKVKALVTQMCLTLCDPMDCSPPGSSLQKILQARTLTWITIPFSRGSFRLRYWTQVSCIVGRLFTNWASKEALSKMFTHWIKTCMMDYNSWACDYNHFILFNKLWGMQASRMGPLLRNGCHYVILSVEPAPALKWKRERSSVISVRRSKFLCPFCVSLNLQIFLS